MPNTDSRTHRFVVRCDDEEMARLRAVAGKLKLSGSDTLRQLLREKYETIFPARRTAT